MTFYLEKMEGSDQGNNQDRLGEYLKERVKQMSEKSEYYYRVYHVIH